MIDLVVLERDLFGDIMKEKFNLNDEEIRILQKNLNQQLERFEQLLKY